MTKTRFIVSPEAIDDLEEIWLHIAEDNFEAANQVEEKLRAAIRMLADRPRAGHKRPDLTDQPVRFWPVYSYLIVYDPEKRPIEIVRVLHGARDIREIL